VGGTPAAQRRVAAVALDWAPSARRLARLMTSARSQLARADALLIATLEAALPSLVKARELVERFQRMLRSGKDEELEGWIDEATASPLASFAKGIRVDREAVAAAIVEPCSKG
jgi:transposase